MRLLYYMMCARAFGYVPHFLSMRAVSTTVPHNPRSGIAPNLAELEHAMIADIINSKLFKANEIGKVAGYSRRSILCNKQKSSMLWLNESSFERCRAA